MNERVHGLKEGWLWALKQGLPHNEYMDVLRDLRAMAEAEIALEEPQEGKLIEEQRRVYAHAIAQALNPDREVQMCSNTRMERMEKAEAYAVGTAVLHLERRGGIAFPGPRVPCFVKQQKAEDWFFPLRVQRGSIGSELPPLILSHEFGEWYSPDVGSPHSFSSRFISPRPYAPIEECVEKFRQALNENPDWLIEEDDYINLPLSETEEQRRIEMAVQEEWERVSFLLRGFKTSEEAIAYLLGCALYGLDNPCVQSTAVSPYNGRLTPRGEEPYDYGKIVLKPGETDYSFESEKHPFD